VLEDYANIEKRRRRFFRAAARSVNSKGNRHFTSEQIKHLFYDHPELRLTYDPANIQLANAAITDFTDNDVQEMFGLIVDSNYMEFLASGDVFWGNYPLKGSLSYPADFMSLGNMPTGDAMGLVKSQLTGNVGLLGPTKSGKTTLLCKWLSSSPELLQTARIVAFVKKPELRHLGTIRTLFDLIITFKRKELALCFSQNPDGVPERAWNNELQRMIGQCYARYSSHRLFGDTLNKLTENRPKDVYPTLRQIVEVLNDFKPRFGMREASYQESVTWCLKDLLNCSDGIWDYSYSDFLEKLFSEPGLAIIELEDLPQEHFTFIVTYFMRWLYFKRLYTS